MHEVLVNRLGGLSLPRKSVVRLTDRPDMILDVYRGRKTTNQQINNTLLETVDLVTMPRNFWHWSVSDIDHRQIGACCACSKCGTFLFAPLMVIVLWPQYREKIAQHMLRAIAVLHFPIYALKSCPALAALAAGAGHYFSLTAYNLTFKPPYRGKGLKNDIS